MNIGNIYVGTKVDTSGLRKDLDKSQQALKNSTQKMQTSLIKLRDIATIAATAIGVSMVYAVQKVARESIKAASDLEEVSSKFNVVFKGQEKVAKEWAETLVGSYAMSIREAKQYLSSIQDLLVPMGMASKEAGELSNEIVKLSADLGSFNNLPTERVMLDIQSALVGNFETMKKYGVVLNATIVQERALAMGLAETKDELNAGMRAQAAYTLMVEGSQAAIGDMARTSESYANQLKLMHARTEDLKAALGDALLPVMTEYLSQLNKVIEASVRWTKENKEGLVKSIELVAKTIEYAIKPLEMWADLWQRLGFKAGGGQAVRGMDYKKDFGSASKTTSSTKNIDSATQSTKKLYTSLKDTSKELKEIAKLEKKVWEDGIKKVEKYDDAIIDANEDMKAFIDDHSSLAQSLSIGLKEYYGQWSTMGDAMEDFYTTQSEVSEKTQNKVFEDYQNMYDKIEDYTADTFYRIFDGQIDSFQDFLDEMEDLFLRTFSQMIATAAAQKIVVPIVASMSDSLLGTAFGSQTGSTGFLSNLFGDSSSWISNVFKGIGAVGLGYTIGSWIGDKIFGGSDRFEANYQSGIRFNQGKGEFWGNPEDWYGSGQIHDSIKQVYTDAINSMNSVFQAFPYDVREAMKPFMEGLDVFLIGGISERHAQAALEDYAERWRTAIDEMFADAMKQEPVMKALREQFILDIGGADAPLDLRLKAINAQYDDYRQQLIDLGATTSELTWLEGQRNKVIQETSKVLEESTSAWEGVAQSIRDQIYNLTTGSLSPLSLTEQMGITQAAIGGIYAKGDITTSDMSRLQGLYGDLLGIGKELYGPVDTGQMWRLPEAKTGAYEQLHSETISRLESLASVADIETDVHLHLYIDGKEIGYTVASQTKTNPELIAAIQRLA